MKPFIDVGQELSGDVAPRRVPGRYPGWWPAESFIIVGDDRPELAFLRPPTFGLEAVPRGERPDSFFRAGHLELTSPSSGARGESLANYLRSRGLDSMDARVPVLAVGSNAAPSQLVYKFRKAGVSASIPTIRVVVENFGVGFVPMVSSFGYIPATFFPAPRLRTQLFLQFFDRNQLDVMDESEGVSKKSEAHLTSGAPNTDGYARVWIDSPIALGDGETLSGAYAYVGRLGLLALDGKPILSDNDSFGGGFDDAETWAIHDPTHELKRAGNQRELQSLLKPHDSSLARDFGKLLSPPSGGDATERAALVEAANARLRALAQPNPLTGQETADSIHGQAAPGVSNLRLYGRLAQELDTSLLPDHERRLGLFRVKPTLDNTERLGESVVVLHPDDFVALGKPSHVSVHNRSIESFLRSGHELEFRAPRAIARCIADPHAQVGGETSAETIPRGSARVDELLRVACGLHLEEIAEIRAVSNNRSVPRRAWDRCVDFLLRKPHYALCRVVLADVTTMEREVALATPLTLQMLGIDSGDYAVIEGVSLGPGPGGAPTWKVSSTGARVFQLDEQTLERRTAMQSGGWLSAYPKAEIALGLAQDLPPLFIDSALRTRLFGKQHGQKVGTVRVRASRPEQVRREIREFVLVVLFSLLIAILTGEATAFSYEPWQVWAFALVLLGTLAVLVLRVRSRYRHTRRSRKWNRATPGANS